LAPKLKNEHHKHFQENGIWVDIFVFNLKPFLCDIFVFNLKPFLCATPPHVPSKNLIAQYDQECYLFRIEMC